MGSDRDGRSASGGAHLVKGWMMIATHLGTDRIGGWVGRWSLSAMVAGLLSAIGLAGPLGAAEVKLGARTLRIPDGFTIEPAAGPPLVDRPITAAFDDAGRLYVADSSGSND